MKNVDKHLLISKHLLYPVPQRALTPTELRERRQHMDYNHNVLPWAGRLPY